MNIRRRSKKKAKPEATLEEVDRAMRFYLKHGYINLKSRKTGRIYKIGHLKWGKGEESQQYTIPIDRDRMKKILKNMQSDLVE